MDNIHDIDALLKRIRKLELENIHLKGLLNKHGIAFEDECVVERVDQNTPAQTIMQTAMQSLSLEEKVALFRGLFKGREDVFARRWYSPVTGKSGYQPVCEREWDRMYCDKKQYKCVDCPNRVFASLSYEHLFRHLAGKDEFGRDVIGVYPLLEDNACNFLCADFDDKSCEHGYKDDVIAFADICKRWSIPYYIERSRSGNGAHVWIFFSIPIAASKARKLGNTILTEAMNVDGKMSLKSYDRLFPNQDILPDGGLGNLVALPLQGKARRDGNSVFVDENFIPYDDQWNVLLNIERIEESLIDRLLQQYGASDTFGVLSKSSEKEPWELPIQTTLNVSDFPSKIKIVKANMVYIPLKGMSAKAINHFKRIAAFKNPEFFAKQGMRLSTYNIPRIISCYSIYDDYIAIPRGCIDSILEILYQYNIKVEIDDRTCKGKEINVTFLGTLRDEQKEALEKMKRYEIGTLSATTAFGKTIFAIAMIAERKVNTLILVHTKALLDQWKKTLEEFLHIEYDDNRKRKKSPIGCLFSGKNTLQRIVDIALIQSCSDSDGAKAFIKEYGMVIVDECHHVSAVNFEQVLRDVRAKYVYGLTATPMRKDGHQPIIFMQCGPIRFTANAASQMEKQAFTRILVPRFTSFRNLTDTPKTYPQLVQAIAEDEIRNELIVSDVHKVIKEGRTPIVLTSLTSHVRYLAEKLSSHATHVLPLVGADSAKDKRQMMERLESVATSESLIIVATGKYIGEGFDYARLDTLFLAMPISWKGNIAQYAGRLHRNYPGKNEVRVYDYVDIRIPLCDSMYRKRLRGYAAIGYNNVKYGVALGMFKPDILYNGLTYWNAFRQDLLSAKRSIVVSSPKINLKYASNIMYVLKELQHTGIEIVLHSNEPESSIQGIDMIKHSDLALQCVIIDRSIVWYGSINFLGYNTEENNVMCIRDKGVANELLNALYE